MVGRASRSDRSSRRPRPALALLAALALAAACEHPEAVSSARVHDTVQNARNAKALLFVGDFESGALDERAYRLRFDGGDATLVGYRVRTGQFAARFELSLEEERAELEPRLSKHGLGEERWYGFSLFLPEDWEPQEEDDAVVQWKHTNDPGENAGSPPLSLRVEGGDWVIHARWDSRRTSDKEQPEGRLTLGRVPCERGRWTDWVFRYRASSAADGMLEIWMDGAPLVRREGPNCYNDEQGLSFRWGLHETGVPRAFFGDELRIGNAQATYEDVVPPGPQ